LEYTNYVTAGNIIATGLAPRTPSNSELGWEKTNSVDFGLELGLWDDA